jgi:molecular chaperone GrpE
MNKKYEEELEPEVMEEANLDDATNTQEEKQAFDDILALKEEISDLTDKLLRNAADAENVRKRLEKQVEEAKIYAIGNFAKDMLSVIDNLSRALEHKPQEMSQEVQNILLGVEMTKQEMINIFTKYKMSAIYPSIGDKFDYNLHSAVAQVSTNDHPEGTILSIMQSGYVIDGRLLRPAMVTVSKVE